MFAKLAGEVLGVDPARISVVSGDTDAFPSGVSTVASRTAVTAGPAVRSAATEVADHLKEVAADMLEAAAADLQLEDGWVRVVGQPDGGMPIEEVVKYVYEMSGVEKLTAMKEVPFGSAAFAFGTHVAEVVVDPETGLVEVVDYTVAHDCGTMLNPMIVAGQLDGGVAHGLGNALLERVSHSEDGQPQVTTFVDYRIMGAGQVPIVKKIHTETPSPTNTLGARGAGEGGTIPAIAAVAAAVEDALHSWGVVVNRYPLHPEVVLSLIRAGTS